MEKQIKKLKKDIKTLHEIVNNRNAYVDNQLERMDNFIYKNERRIKLPRLNSFETLRFIVGVCTIAVSISYIFFKQ